MFEKAILVCKRKSDDPSSLVHLNSLYTPHLAPNSVPNHHHHHHHNQASINHHNHHNGQLSSTSTLSSVSSSSSSSTSTTATISSTNNVVAGGGGAGGSGCSYSSSLSSASTATFNGVQYFYQFKEMIKTNEIGLTENLKNDKKKFEIWSETSSYIFEVRNYFFFFLLYSCFVLRFLMYS